MRDFTEEDYTKFEEGFVKLCLDVFSTMPTQWVVPMLFLDENMEVMEDVLVPQAQLVQNTLGMLSWASTELKAAIAEQRGADD